MIVLVLFDCHDGLMHRVEVDHSSIYNSLQECDRGGRIDGMTGTGITLNDHQFRA
jgi:hypothetical protein